MNAFFNKARHEVPDRIEALTGLRIYHRPLPSLKTADDPDLVVHAGGKIFVIEVKASARTATVAQAARRIREIAGHFGKTAVPLVVVPYMGESGARVCGELKVGFLDLSGNAHIETRGVHVHVEGKPNQYVERGRPSSPFAPKSARLTRILLMDPGRWWTQKELAVSSGLGAGFVSRIVRRLGEDGLLERDEKRRLKPINPAALFQAWSDDYDFTKHDTTRLHIAERNGPELLKRVAGSLDPARMRHAFTGLAAAWKYDPFAAFRLATMYADAPPTSSVLENLGGRVVERGANLWWVVPNDEGVFDGQQVIDQIPCVSAVQVYLDLRYHPERSSEASQRLLDTHLGWEE